MNETPQASYYANVEEIENAQKHFRTREIKKFLQQFKKEEQNATIIDFQRDLKDLGIDPASLFEFGGEFHQR
jgi:inorganic pyrophosphatase